MDASTSDPVRPCTYYSRAIEKPVFSRPTHHPTWAKVTAAAESCAINLTARAAEDVLMPIKGAINVAAPRGNSHDTTAVRVAYAVRQVNRERPANPGDFGKAAFASTSRSLLRFICCLFSSLRPMPFCARNLSGASEKRSRKRAPRWVNRSGFLYEIPFTN